MSSTDQCNGKCLNSNADATTTLTRACNLTIAVKNCFYVMVKSCSVNFCLYFCAFLAIFLHSVFLLPAPPEATDQGLSGGGRRDLKSIPFINYLLALQKSQLLSDDLVNGVEIRCEEKGSCPSACHLCHHQGMMGGGSGRSRNSNGRSGEQPSPIPVLLEVSRVVPLYSLIQDNITKEVRKRHIDLPLYQKRPN